MGPGTDVIERIRAGQTGIDPDDDTSKLHDLNYLKSRNILDIYRADIQAIQQYNNDSHGFIGKTGLFLKDLLMPPVLQQIFVGNQELPEDIDKVYSLASSDAISQG